MAVRAAWLALSALLLAGQLAALREQSRGEGDAAPAEKVRSLFVQSEGLVCGGGEIKTLLGSDSSLTRVRNLPWSKVMAIANNFMASQQRKVDVLLVEVEGLQTALAKAIQDESPRALADNEIDAAITAAVSVPGSYGSLALAQKTKCGGVLPKNRAERPPPGAYDGAVEAFKAEIPKVIGSGNIRVDGATFMDACGKLLGNGQELDGESFCGELCQSFAESAQALSDELVGGGVGGTGSAELQTQLDAKTNELKVAQSSLSGCKSAKDDLGAFQQELEGLQVVIKDEHVKVRDARFALSNAEGELEDVEEALVTQGETLKNLEELVKGSGEKVASAKALLQELTQQNDATRGSIADCESQLQATSAQVKRASDASQTAQALRSQLSTVLLKMSLYFDAAVRKPIRDLGLGETVKVRQYFPEKPKELQEAGATAAAMVSLESFCSSEETKRVFTELKLPDIDGFKLCNFGATSEAINAEIDGAVSLRMGKVKEDLERVQTWLNPLKGQDTVTNDQVQAWVQEGEPQGLRVIIAMMSNTEFYRKYLKQWTVKGAFIKLLRRLATAVKDTTAEQENLQAILAGLMAQLQTGIQKQGEAADALKQAIDANEIDEASRAKAEAEFTSLKNQQAALEDTLAKLRAAAEAAEAKYKAAVEALQNTHRQGTVLLQIMGHYGLLEQEDVSEGQERQVYPHLS